MDRPLLAVGIIIIALTIIIGSSFLVPAPSISANNTQTIAFESCTDQACMDAYFAAIVIKENPQAAFADLKARYESDPRVRGECHQLTHSIGRAAAKKYPSVSTAYVEGDGFCWSGYYHGVMEATLAREDPATLPSKMNYICADIPGKSTYSFDYYNCVHGLGHGVMYINNNELFDSLEECNHLQGSYEQSSCWSGAFMENVIADNKNHFTKFLKPEDPLYPCDAVKDKYKTTCYLMQTSYMLKVSNYDFSKVFTLCEGVGEAYLDTCYQSLGRDASGQSISDVERTKTTCLLGKTDRAQRNCVIGAVKDFISYHHSDAQAKELCAALPENLQETCFATTQSYFAIF